MYIIIDEVASQPASCDHEHYDYLLPYVFANKRLYQKIILESSREQQDAAKKDLKHLEEVLTGVVGMHHGEFYTCSLPESSANSYDEDM